MYLIRVIPISKGVSVEELSYYTASSMPVGCLIDVPVRKRVVPALVTACVHVREAKQEIRTADYALRKIDTPLPRVFFDDATLRAATTLAEYHASSIGAVLSHLLPATLTTLEGTETSLHLQRGDSRTGSERVVQAPRIARTETYKTTVREAFAQKQSVLIVTPTRAEAESLYTSLAPPLHGNTFLLHSGLTPKVQQTAWQQALSTEHPILIVATYGYAALPRHDLGYMIVERESSPQYRTAKRPYIVMRDVIRTIAGERGITYIGADLPLSIETIARLEDGRALKLPTDMSRTGISSELVLFDARRPEGAPAPKQFSVLAKDVASTITHAAAGDKTVLVYSTRRGLAPVTICQDCEETVACKNCGASVTLHSSSNENLFLCHSCGTMRHARERCLRCNSWRLTTLGIAVEGVAQELARLLPKGTPLYTISSDAVRSHARAQELVRNLYSTKGVLVCTEMALPYLSTPLDVGVVTSLDSLLALPAWNMHERIAGLTTRLRELSREILIVQTRRPQSALLQKLAKGDYKSYYNDELSVRRDLGYPPFVRLVKLSVRGTHAHVTERTRELTDRLAPFGFEPVSHFLRGPKGEYVMHGFLRCTAQDWPKQDIVRTLRTLPPDVTVRIDPDSVL